MKEFYNAPEAKMVCFFAAQNLASNVLDFDDLLSKGESKNPVNPNESDIELDLGEL